MKTYDEIRSVRRIKRSLLIVLVVFLAMVGVASAAPSASFTYSIVSGTANAPLGVQFWGQSSDPNVTWTWDFAEPGGSSTFQNPVYTFLYAGLHSVTLTVQNYTSEESGSISHPITVNLSPDFTASPSEGFANLTVHFTDVSTGHPQVWNWTFVDGEVHNGVDSSIDHTYIKSGKFAANVSVTGNAVSNLSANKIITVNPRADFTINPSPGNVSNTFLFNGTSTGTPVVSYTWFFGDGVSSVNSVTGSTNNVSHSFSVANTYYPNLTVTGQDATSSGVITKSLAVSPVAIFTANPTNPVAGRPVQFTDGSLGDIANQLSGPGTWLWEFGDGATSQDRNPIHMYQAGRFIAKLTVTKNGLSDSTTTVINTDSANLFLLRSGINGNTYFRADKYGVHPGNSVNLTAYSTRSVIRQNFRPVPSTTRYNWTFSGANNPIANSFSSGWSSSPFYTFSTQHVDIYTVTLQVEDSRDFYTVTKPRLIVVR